MGFSNKVLFIVGAGASKPYGFPTGTELVDGYFRSPQLHELARPYAELHRTFLDEVQLHMQSLQRRLSAAASPSIDEFLRDHSNYGDVCRFAIAHWFLELEEKTVRERPDRSRDWIAWVFEHAYRRDSKALSDRVRFVTFNYDRSIELSFQSLLAARHGWTLADARSAVEQLAIIHVYGSLKAAWREGEPDFLPVPATGPHAAIEAAKGIRLMGDARSEDAASTARDYLAWAETVVCIGFGYHKTNIDVFSRSSENAVTGGPPKRAVHFGAYGLLEAERETVFSRCHSPFGFDQIRPVQPYWSNEQEDILTFLRRTARFVT